MMIDKQMFTCRQLSNLRVNILQFACNMLHVGQHCLHATNSTCKNSTPHYIEKPGNWAQRMREALAINKYINININIYIYLYLCKCIIYICFLRIDLCTLMCVRDARIYIYIYIYIHTFKHMHACGHPLHTCIHACMHARMHTRNTHTYIHTLPTYTHACIHICIATFTHRCARTSTHTCSTPHRNTSRYTTSGQRCMWEWHTCMHARMRACMDCIALRAYTHMPTMCAQMHELHKHMHASHLTSSAHTQIVTKHAHIPTHTHHTHTHT